MNTSNEKGALAGPLVRHFSPADSNSLRAPAAKNILRDAIIAAGVEAYAGVAILSAAESYAKARVRDEFAAFRAELDSPAVQA